jgi:hypothetical protein
MAGVEIPLNESAKEIEKENETVTEMNDKETGNAMKEMPNE